MQQRHHVLSLATRGKGLYEFTGEVLGWVMDTGLRNGLLTLFVRHTSASLLIQENADPTVQADLERFLSRLVPDGDPIFRHRMEGPDDMSAHARTALTQVHLSVPLVDGALTLGTWQGIFLFEHRIDPQQRQVMFHLLGE
jgi:secondary thiamine-phosphate synthase enzyme